MNLKTLVWRELFERKSQMITIFVGTRTRWLR